MWEQGVSHLITIVVATYNSNATLQRCIDSITGQIYPHKELIVIDGGSSDGTVEILKQNSEKVRYWVSELDRGIYHAWNKALEQSHGDWVCFLGADDYLWDEHVLEQMAPHLSRAFPAVRVVYGQVARVNKSGTVLDSLGGPWPELRAALLVGDMLNVHQATFHHRSLFEVRGNFDESFRIAGDYDLLLRELLIGQAEYVPFRVAAMQHGGISSSPSSKVVMIREIKRAMERNGVKPPMKSYVAWLRAIIHALLYHVTGAGISGAIADGYRYLAGKSRLWTSTGQ